MDNIPFAQIAELMNRLLDQAAEHRRIRCGLTPHYRSLNIAEAERTPAHGPPSPIREGLRETHSSERFLAIARQAGVALVETDFGGPCSQFLECARCRTMWRIYRDRTGNWPHEWWRCPNQAKHPPADQGLGSSTAAA